MSKPLWMPDLGNGQYQNPVLLCDYSDPDVIRVGDTYYLTASSFNYVPGLPILTSADLVNWTLVNYALPRIPDERYNTPRHAQGVWAPSIRYHAGLFYIYYGMPDEGIFMVKTADPLGAWDAPVCVLPGKGLIDPCPFWDDDGSAWVVHGYARSRIGFKSFLGIFPMTADGTRATGDDHLLYNGLTTQPTIEGPKVYKREGYYYIFAPAGGVDGGWQTVLRSRSLHGPYEERGVLSQGDTPVNGPHQGGWVTSPDGKDWFLHFQSRGLYGRITHLQPMRWEADGWPVMGDEGCPVLTHEKPAAPAGVTPVAPACGDDFQNGLDLQWQFMGNPRPDFYEVGGGRLTLYARGVAEADGTLWPCPQVLSQKIAGLSFTAQTTLDASALADGDRAGLCLLGGSIGGLAVRCAGDAFTLEALHDTASAVLNGAKVELRMRLTQTAYNAAEARFFYRIPGADWTPLGDSFTPGRHTWVGARIGLFAVPQGHEDGGSACFGPLEVMA